MLRRPRPPFAGFHTLIGAGCAATSGLAILLYAAGVVHMPAAVTFISVPGGLALAMLGVVARRRHQQLFFHRLAVGTWAGFLATLAYDGSRWLVQAPGWLPFDTFVALPIFGSLILGMPPEETAAQVAGWFYHFWNGISFGIIYALLAGQAPWPWGLALGLTLEGLMIASYPVIFGLQLSNWAFLAVSVWGHVFYGITLGLLVQRYNGLPGEHVGSLGLPR